MPTSTSKVSTMPRGATASVGMIAYDSQPGIVSGKAPAEYLSATLALEAGNVVEISVSGSAQGAFYYAVEDASGNSTSLFDSSRALGPVDFWTPVSTNALFRAKKKANVNYRLKLMKSDLSGNFKLSNISLIAQIVGKD